MRLDVDVTVVGSGPAGCMAAYVLADAGMRVAMIEKEILPRYKTCGGGLVHRARKSIPFDIGPVVERDFYQAEFYCYGHHFSMRRQKPIISMVMRDRFDYFLVNRAADAGAEISDGSALTDIRDFDSDRIKVKTNRSTICSRYLVGADGAYSRVAKICGFTDRRLLIPALEYEVWTDAEILKELGSEVRFDLGIIPQGYGWVFPKQDHLSIGVGHFQRNRIDLKQYCSEYIQALGIRDAVKTIRHGYQIPTRPRGLHAKNNVLLAGDAAGLADPVVAEGISNALLSGTMAANSIIKAVNKGEPVSGIYNRCLNEEVLSPIRHAVFAANLLYEHEWMSRRLFEKRGTMISDWYTEIFMGERNYPESLADYASAFLKILRNRKRSV